MTNRYEEILDALAHEKKIFESNNIHFSFDQYENGFVEIEDFQDVGMLSFSKGIPFSKISAGEHNLNGKKIYIDETFFQKCIESIDNMVIRL